MTIQLPDNWITSEKGNTLLTGDDGNLVAWIRINDTHCFEVSYTPVNCPAFYISVCDYDPVRISQHVVEELGGWQVVRWNLSDEAPIDANGCIVGEE